MMDIYIAEEHEDHESPECLGVFDDKDKAISACLKREKEREPRRKSYDSYEYSATLWLLNNDNGKEVWYKDAAGNIEDTEE